MITTLIICICISIITAFYFGYRLGRTSYEAEDELRQELVRLVNEKERLTIHPHFKTFFTSKDLVDLATMEFKPGEVDIDAAPKRKRGRPRKNS